ncbi:MBL fold metallo-hydrolase [Streptantibioticus rubrisoli]|uniref:MBL fold metallo-hydrolase n=1 Tax=Streptantibioticus rubrisoli TaxID=1387313 RepID=A0ABT1PGK7_9ACTN|nr:MBL fold metallo-hydrolase [Streptantibioticus rubrisoli]MCQ4044501.1 MBL fold metallo-hydrolase [Streptantibioticus rubrisoli]
MRSQVGENGSEARPRTEEIAPGVHAYVQPHGGWCVSNSGIVVGTDAVVVIDTAATESRARALLDTVLTLAPGRRQLVVSTHHHGDHTFGNWVFAPHATLIAHELGPAEVVRKGLGMQRMWHDVAWGRIDITLPSVTMRDHLTLHTGGPRVELAHYGTAHAQDDIVAWLPEHRVLFAGDILFSGCTPFVLMGSLDGSLRAMARLRELEPRVIVCGHGEVCGPEVIDANEAYLRWVRETARAARAQGLTPLEAARRADLGEFAGLRDPERLVANLHRAYFELEGGAPGGYISSTPVMREMVEYNGGRPLTCTA